MDVFKGSERSIFADDEPLESEHLRIMNDAHINTFVKKNCL